MLVMQDNVSLDSVVQKLHMYGGAEDIMFCMCTVVFVKTFLEMIM